MKRLWYCCIVASMVCFQGAKAQSVCDQVSKIEILPFHQEHVDDPAYNALVAAGDSAIPCLLEKVIDGRKMNDPRQAPRMQGLDAKVGDVALFVLVDITNLDFVKLLPAKWRKLYETEGVYAYFRFVQNQKNRKWFQRRLIHWYRETYPRKVAA